ncbi:hypothetical protein ST47_g3362 [Ascochyta rabiei]|uniref:Uncharacterized protein n=1 Tax=Didymella rabiei TaxID=5454 RepID=A0A163HVT9_DIDRA|nr:hypothetical protein ST47_g3362 [Ascochyta rabiei]
MAGQQMPRRKMLSQRKPTKVLKKHKTIVKYDRRDCELTAHQQSWARSLAVSLSGWRKRQAFLKAQLEAHVNAESARVAEEATLQATLQAQEDERRAQSVILTAEADARFARDAAAYRRRAIEIYQSNIEDETEEERDDEEYMHDYITKLCKYGSSTKRRKVQDIEDDDRDESDTENPDVMSSAKTYPTPIFPSATNVDWRVKAQNGIAKKKLTIDKGWSAVTWNQKSNVHERLLLLESDGFGISQLQDRKASSEEITAIILERAAVQQRPDNTASLPVQTHEEGKPVADRQASPPQPPTNASPISDHQNAPAPMPQSATPPIPEDDTQPFCFDEPYQPRASPRLKRKRDCHSDDEDSEDTAAISSYPPLKKRNIVFHTVDALRLQALQEIKRKVLRCVFRPARSICQEPSPCSKIIFSAEALSSSRKEKHTTSILDYLYAQHASMSSPDEPLSIPLTGYSNIMAELRFLTDTSSATETSMTIIDPDFVDEELNSTAVFQSETEDSSPHKQVTTEDFYRKKSRITISKDEQNRQVFRGDALTLAELFKVLQQRELSYRVDWEWDGLRLIPSSALLWSLGPETLDTLLNIEHRLRQCAGAGGAEICIQKLGSERAGFS